MFSPRLLFQMTYVPRLGGVATEAIARHIAAVDVYDPVLCSRSTRSRINCQNLLPVLQRQVVLHTFGNLRCTTMNRRRRRCGDRCRDSVCELVEILVEIALRFLQQRELILREGYRWERKDERR
jgi:hypothetical protein